MRTARFCTSGGVGYMAGKPYPWIANTPQYPDTPIPALMPYPLEGTWDQRYPTPSPRRDMVLSDTWFYLLHWFPFYVLFTYFVFFLDIDLAIISKQRWKDVSIVALNGAEDFMPWGNLRSLIMQSIDTLYNAFLLWLAIFSCRRKLLHYNKIITKNSLSWWCTLKQVRG